MICYLNYENEEKFKIKYNINTIVFYAILAAILLYPYFKRMSEHDFFLD